MLERPAELEAARRLLDDIDDGACALFLEGDPGIGKTTLMNAVAAEAAGRGMRVLRGRPTHSEVRLAHAALIELLDGLAGDVVDALPGPQRRAMRVALRWDDPGDVPAEHQTIAAALAGVLRALSDAGPVLIAIDDVHWLDPATAQALEFAMRRVEDRPVGVIAAARTGEGDRPRPTERSVPPDRVRRHMVEPLGEASLVQLLGERPEGRLPASTAARVARAARGNAFAALEIARALDGEPPPGPNEPLPVPTDIRDLVARRMRDLPAATRRALQVVTASPRPTSPPVAREALAPAELAGVVRVGSDGAVTFTHPLYESAIIALTPPSRRRRIHARLARTSGDIEERARHLALAAPGADGEVAGVLEDAARHSAARGAPHTAAELAEHAWRLTPATLPDDAARRALTACELLVRSGRHAQITGLIDELLPSLTAGDRGRALLLLGEARAWAGAPASAIPVLDEALVHLDGDDSAAARVHMALAFIVFHLGDDMSGVLHHAEHAVRRATAAGRGGPLGEALATRAVTTWLVNGGFDPVELRRAEELFEERHPVPVQFNPVAVRAMITGYADDPAGAAAVFAHQMRRLTELGRIGDIPYLGLHQGTLAGWCGDREGLLRTAALVAPIAEEIGGALPRAVAGFLTASAAAYIGDADGARRAGLEALGVSAEHGTGALNAWITGMLAKLELSLGDPAAALDWVLPDLQRLDPERLADPAALFHLPDAMEALIVNDRPGCAAALLDGFERRSRELGRAWTLAASRRCRALVAARDGDLALAADHARAAVDGLAASGFPVELGRAYLVLGQVERRRRRRAAARTAIEAALAAFDGAQATLWAARAREELGRTWTRGTDVHLSPSEERIARLAADGLTNPQIADRLHVSRRTVEATLTRVFGKLRISGRGDLRRHLPEPNGDSGESNPD